VPHVRALIAGVPRRPIGRIGRIGRIGPVGVWCASNGSRLAERYSAPSGLHEGSGETSLPGGAWGSAPRGLPRCPGSCQPQPPRRCASNGSRPAERYSAPSGLHEGSGETSLPGGVWGSAPRGLPRCPGDCQPQPPRRCASNGSRLAARYPAPAAFTRGPGGRVSPAGFGAAPHSSRPSTWPRGYRGRSRCSASRFPPDRESGFGRL